MKDKIVIFSWGVALAVMLSLAVGITMSGCAVMPKSPAQSVYLAKTNYAAALTVAVTYKKLPSCDTPGHPKLCAQPAIVVRLQKADDAAYALLEGAEVTVRSGVGNVDMAILAAKQAVSAFTTITNSLKEF